MKHIFYFIALPAILILFTASSSIIGNSPFEGLLQVENANYDVTFYHLDLNVSDTSTYISGSTTIHIRSLVSSLQEALFDFSNLLTTDSVIIGGERVQFSHEVNEINVVFNESLPESDELAVQIFYHGLGKNHETEGIYNRYNASWDKNITWTLTEPFHARNFFPCKQALTDKADSVYVFLSTDSSLKAGSNGVLTAEIPLAGDRVRYEWKSKFPIAYYLISFSVSDYMDYSYHVKLPESSDSILVQNYIYNDSNYYIQNKNSIDKTGDLLVLYSKLFGPYPFRTEKYGHCVAPFSGGMEHQTMTTLVNFSFLLVAHELTHQWFGDFVTCSTWQDIWINEGFASYGEYLAYQYLTSQTDADNWIESSNDYVKSAAGGSVFVPESSAENESRIFDSRLSYKKGASIIHMIRQETGNDSLFFDIMTTFLDKYRNSNASGADFRDHLELKTGKDFNQFFNQWYYGQGYPIHSIQWDHRNDTLYVNSLQTVSSETPFFNLQLEFRITGENFDTLVAFRQDANFNKWQMYLPGNVNMVIPDPNHWLLLEISDISIIDESGNDSGFSVVPNPATDKVLISAPEDRPSVRYSIILANAEGRIMVRRESTSQVEEIHVNSFPAGMYFVIIKSGSSTLHKKLIIN